MSEELPEIYLHIKKTGFDLQSIFAQYFITILFYYTPLEISKRIMDIFLLSKRNCYFFHSYFVEGEQIIFDILIRAMQLCSKEILSLNDPSVKNFLDHFNNFV